MGYPEKTSPKKHHPVNTKIPAYLYEKGNIIRLVLLTAVFALLFINIFQPFGSRAWYPEISELKYIFFSSLIILTGMYFARFTMMVHPCMTPYTNWHNVTSLMRCANWKRLRRPHDRFSVRGAGRHPVRRC